MGACMCVYVCVCAVLLTRVDGYLCPGRSCDGSGRSCDGGGRSCDGSWPLLRREWPLLRRERTTNEG